MDLEQTVLELRKRINKLRTELDLNPSTQHKTLDATSEGRIKDSSHEGRIKDSSHTQLDNNTSSSSANDIKAALLANKRKT